MALPLADDTVTNSSKRGEPPPERSEKDMKAAPGDRLVVRRVAPHAPIRDAEILDDPDHAAADRDVAHELRRPRVDLLVALVLEPGAVFPGVGREA